MLATTHARADRRAAVGSPAGTPARLLPALCVLFVVLFVVCGCGVVAAQPPLGSTRADAAISLRAFGPGGPLADLPTFAPTPLTAGLRACLPARLHPVSRQFLDLWLRSRIGTRTFRRFFHMPNSDYLPVGECLLRERQRMAHAARPGTPA